MNGFQKNKNYVTNQSEETNENMLLCENNEAHVTCDDKLVDMRQLWIAMIEIKFENDMS